MDIKLQLLTNQITELLYSNLPELSLDANEIADTTAIAALREIQEIIQDDDLSDFDAVDEITVVFEKYNLDFGPRHDF